MTAGAAVCGALLAASVYFLLCRTGKQNSPVRLPLLIGCFSTVLFSTVLAIGYPDWFLAESPTVWLAVFITSYALGTITMFDADAD